MYKSRSILLLVLSIFLIGSVFLFQEASKDNKITGKVTQILTSPTSSQNTLVFDLSEGNCIGCSYSTGKITSQSTTAVWQSPQINTRPQGGEYSFWEELRIVGSPTIEFQSRTSFDGVTWNSWTQAKTIEQINSIDSSQEKYIQLQILFNSAGQEVSEITLKFSPAFEFMINPLEYNPQFVDFTYPRADRPVVVQGEKLFFDNGDGTFEEARFYGMQMYGYSMLPTHQQADNLCQYLADKGFNLIKTQIAGNSPAGSNPQGRTIIQLFQDGTNSHSGSALVFNQENLDRMDYFISRCKEEGIYTYFRINSPAPHQDDVFDEWSIRPTTRYTDFFIDSHRQLHIDYYTQLLNRINPYTGIAYKNDPAVAFIELENENQLFRAWKSTGDNPLFADNFQPTYPGQYNPTATITPLQNQTLNALWNQWLLDTYTDRQTLLDRWGTEAQGGLRSYEDPALGTVKRSDWRYAPGTESGRADLIGQNFLRYHDNALFYKHLQDEYYADHINELKNVLNVQNNIIVGNTFWGSYDMQSQMAGDVIDHHTYFLQMDGNPSIPQLTGAKNTEYTIIRKLVDMNIKGKPFSVSEYNDFSFNYYAPEIHPFAASYFAFQGVDSMVMFDFFEFPLVPEERRVYNWASAYDPVRMMQSPINSLIFREYISPANIEIELFEADQEQFYRGQAFMDANGRYGTLGLVEGNWNNLGNYLKNNYLFKHGIRYTGFSESQEMNWQDYVNNYGVSINEPNQVWSDTNELYIDADLGIFRIHHPKVQGVSGITGGMTHIMEDLEVDITETTKNAGTVLLTSLDNKTIDNSSKMLLFVGGRIENYQLKWLEDYSNVFRDYTLPYNDAYGITPVLATIPEVTVRIQTENSNLLVEALDVDGIPKAIIPSNYQDGILSFSVDSNDETVWFAISSDCRVSNGGVEIFDGIDNDCDGQIDEGTTPSANNADLNNDGVVDIYDLLVISDHFGLDSDSLNWNPAVDRCRTDFEINVLDMLCVINNFSPIEQPTLAFPGAEGYGANTPGGRGGTIYKITSLADNGPGTLRECIEASGPRTCIFEVSGVIELNTWLYITNPYISIFGQTAPAPGITIKNDEFRISTHDVIIQHLRLRPGDQTLGIPFPITRGEGNIDALTIADHHITGQNPYNIIIDQISASWAIDENIGIGINGEANLTISNSIISEALNNSYHPKGPHSMGLLVMGEAKKVSLLNNLLAHSVNRNPRIADGTQVLLANNFVYEPGFWLAELSGYNQSQPLELVAINNEVKTKPTNMVHDYYFGGFMDMINQSSKIFSLNNECSALAPCINPLYNNLLVSSYPFTMPTFTIHEDAESYVLTNAGAKPRDVIDSRIINQVITTTGNFVDSPSDVGGYDFTSNTRTLTLPINPNDDDNGNGYTNLEDWIHTNFS